MNWNLATIFYLYLLEGIPYGLQSRFLPLVLRSKGVSLTALGFYKLLYIPWILKCFYAPIVETYYTKPFWLLISLSGLCSITGILSKAFDHIPSTENANDSLFSVWLVSFCLVMLNFGSAFLDVVVDGLALKILLPDQFSAGNTIQVVGYKVGSCVGGGFLTWLSSAFLVNQLLMVIAFIYLSGIFLCMMKANRLSPENRSTPMTNSVFQASQFNSKSNTEHNSYSSNSFNHKDYINMFYQSLIHPSGSRNLIILLLIYKLGEQGAMNMLPLLLFDRGASLSKVGLWTGIMGQLASTFGSALGYFVNDIFHSPLTSLLYLMTVRAFLQCPLLFVSSATFGSIFPNVSFYLGSLCMNVGLIVSGAITTEMFTLMMHCTRAESSERTEATHYTLLSTAEILGKLLFSTVAAYFTDVFGYCIANLAFICLSIAPICFVLVMRVVASKDTPDLCHTVDDFSELLSSFQSLSGSTN